VKFITVSRKLERYNIKARAAEAGVLLKDLLAECNKRTGRKMRLCDFTKARAGIDRSPGAEQTLEVADQILRELELHNKRKELTR
jgi:hypothetical protein